MDKKVVGVTGATGTIGKVLVKKLAEMGYEIKSDRIEVSNLDEVKKFVKGCDYLVHLAVEMDVSKGKEVFRKTNILGVKNILECVDGNLKSVLVSSVVVFKENSEEIRDTTTNNFYTDSKVEGLKLIRSSTKKVVTVMPSIVVNGKTLNKRSKPFSSEVLNWIYNHIGGGIPGGIMGAIGDPDRIVNIVEVNDVVEGIILAMEKGKLGEEYILCGENIRIGDYLKKMSKLSGKNYLKIRIPFWLVKLMNIFVKNIQILKPEDMSYSYKKARNELGYLPNWKL